MPAARPLAAVAAALLLAGLAGAGPSSAVATSPATPATSSSATAAATSTDPDHDGLPSAFETTWSRTSPSRADTDGDGVKDGLEDPDHDGLTNRQEYIAKTNPRRADSDADGTKDPSEDPDHDRLPNWFEFRAGTHPLRVDTDRDGTPDGAEDADRDGLSNRREYLAGTNPRAADTDGDGAGDAAEIKVGSDPRDPASTPATLTAPTLPDAPGCPVFPATNAWNHRIDRWPVRGDSATLVGSIGATLKLHPDFGSYLGYGIPYNVVDSGQAAVRVAFEYVDESDDVPYPIPAAPRMESGSDRHILIVDRDACRLYELYAASRAADGSWSAGSGATWDLRSNALRPAGWTSADAAGLAILPGLVRYDEVAAGEIRHAIRFTAPVTRRAYVYPARHYASSSTSAALPPMGLRVRLKASYDVSRLPPQARVIAVAMQRYGLVLADNGSSWFFQGVSDARFDDDQLNALKAIPGSAFEAVDTSGLVNGP
jgi:hypothetical protein